jgi:ribosomal protein L11 methyltransferase
VARYSLPPQAIESLTAELDSLGTLGLEERDSENGEQLVLAYFPMGGVDDAALAEAARVDPRARFLGCEPVPDTDWEQAWRAGLEPRRIAGLWVRPSWCATAGAPEIVIDPKQAFGSGEHASTRLALALLLEALAPGDALLDVGCGSGILALGALRCGAGAAVGFDLDPVACVNAAENRRLNALPLQLYCGTLDALAPGVRFDLVAANLIWPQLESCLPRLLELPRRALVVSGLLGAQRGLALSRLLGPGWEAGGEREEAQGGDVWCALRLHRRSRQS